MPRTYYLDADPGYVPQDHDPSFDAKRLSRDPSERATFAHEPQRRVPCAEERYLDMALGVWRLVKKPEPVRVDRKPRRPKGRVVRPRQPDAAGVRYAVRDAMTGYNLWYITAATWTLAKLEGERLAIEAGVNTFDVVVVRDLS